MQVIRHSKNSRVMIILDGNTDREVFERVLARGLNTWVEPSPQLLGVHEELKRPLVSSRMPEPQSTPTADVFSIIGAGIRKVLG